MYNDQHSSSSHTLDAQSPQWHEHSDGISELPDISTCLEPHKAMKDYNCLLMQDKHAMIYSPV